MDADHPICGVLIPCRNTLHAADRSKALDALRAALRGTEVAGSTVNTAFLAALVADADFAAGDVDTGLIGREQVELTAQTSPSNGALAAAAVAVSDAKLPAGAADPWDALAGYAHWCPTRRTVRLSRGDSETVACVYARAGRLVAEIDGVERPIPARARVAVWPGHVTVFEGAVAHNFAAPDPFADAANPAAGTGSLRAPMPGLVKLVSTAAGEWVVKGQSLLVLEAMKMEHTIAAPHDGEIAEIVAEGSQVADGTVLVRFVDIEPTAATPLQQA